MLKMPSTTIAANESFFSPNHPIILAQNEERARREAIYNEISLLSALIRDAYISSDYKETVSVLWEEIKEAIANDIVWRETLMTQLSVSQLSQAAKTNKLKEILEGVSSLIASKDRFVSMLTQPIESYINIDSKQPTIFVDKKAFLDPDYLKVNAVGTSRPNFLQTAMLRTLSILKGVKNFNNLKEYLGDIYDVDKSPCIQTVGLREALYSDEVKAGFFFDEADGGSIVVPHLGYYFGGSREDGRYRFENKPFLAEDCSSALARWTGSETYSTATMGLVAWESLGYELNITKTEGQQLEHVKAKLTYLPCDQEARPAIVPAGVIVKEGMFGPRSKALKHPEAAVGDIYVIRGRNQANEAVGHTGIVTALHEDGSGFTSLSDTRDMPNIEGFGYDSRSYDGYLEFSFFRFSGATEAATTKLVSVNCDPGFMSRS